MGTVFRNLGRPDDVKINEPIEWICEECGIKVWSAEQPDEIKHEKDHTCKFVKKMNVELKSEG